MTETDRLASPQELQRALSRQTQYLDVLHRVTLGLIDHLELSELFQAIVAGAASLAGTENGYIYLPKADGEHLEVVVGVGTYAQFIGYTLARDVGLAGKVWTRGTPLLVEDYDRWGERDPAFPTGILRAALAVPLTSGGTVVGVIGLSHTEGEKAFGEEEVALLGRFAELASVVLDNARLYEAAREELGERQRVEEALRASEGQLRTAEAQYRNLVEQIPAITYINELDQSAPDGYRTLYVSPQVEALLGYSPDDLVADPRLWATLVHPEDRVWVQGRDAEFMEQGRDLTAEYRLLTSTGEVVWVHDAARVVRHEGGAPFAQGVIYDITERKQVEERLELTLAREREAGQRLRAIDEMKTTFLHAVSHELRTPLAAVLGLALTLQRTNSLSPEEVQDFLSRLAANARKLDRLLSDLLDLDRLDQGIVEPRRRTVDLRDLVRRTVDGSEAIAGRDVHVEGEPLELPVDPAKIERIVENLLANAARHTPPGTKIWVGIRPFDGGALLYVDDEGEGVPPDLRHTVFEPFRRGPDAPRHAPGVGIGLSLVARFAELHGGRAWIEERPGGGASFRVFLPPFDYPFSTGAPTREPYSVQDPS